MNTTTFNLGAPIADAPSESESSEVSLADAAAFLATLATAMHAIAEPFKETSEVALLGDSHHGSADAGFAPLMEGVAQEADQTVVVATARDTHETSARTPSPGGISTLSAQRSEVAPLRYDSERSMGEYIAPALLLPSRRPTLAAQVAPEAAMQPAGSALTGSKQTLASLEPHATASAPRATPVSQGATETPHPVAGANVPPATPSPTTLNPATPSPTTLSPATPSPTTLSPTTVDSAAQRLAATSPTTASSTTEGSTRAGSTRAGSTTESSATRSSPAQSDSALPPRRELATDEKPSASTGLGESARAPSAPRSVDPVQRSQATLANIQNAPTGAEALELPDARGNHDASLGDAEVPQERSGAETRSRVARLHDRTLAGHSPRSHQTSDEAHAPGALELAAPNPERTEEAEPNFLDSGTKSPAITDARVAPVSQDTAGTPLATASALNTPEASPGSSSRLLEHLRASFPAAEVRISEGRAGETLVSMNHPDFGAVELNLQMTSGGIDIAARVDGAIAASLLRRSETSLRKTIHRRGLSLGRLRVERNQKHPSRRSKRGIDLEA